MRIGVVACGLLMASPIAYAHRIDEYLQATVLSLSVDHVQVAMRMIPGVRVASEVIATIDSDGNGRFSAEEQRAYAERVIHDLTLTLNDDAIQPQIVSYGFPLPQQMRDGMGEIRIDFAANLQGAVERRLRLVNHHRVRDSVYLVNVLVPEDQNIHILTQQRSQQQSTYEVDYREAPVVAGSVGASHRSLEGGQHYFQFSTLFMLGVHHIAEGTDHLLFLLTLLLPAPLRTAGSRWGPPIGIRPSLLGIARLLTAFTVGHSLTLGLAAFGILDVATRPIEGLIAVSIAVSALHAWRPFAAGQGVWIAAFFGLIHGLAFATTLQRLGLSPGQRVVGVVAFNLGIEAMQLLIVAAVLPSLIMLSRLGGYTRLRNGGALFAGTAAACWIVERLCGIDTPVDFVLNAAAHRAPWIAAGLLVISLATWAHHCRHPV